MAGRGGRPRAVEEAHFEGVKMVQNGLLRSSIARDVTSLTQPHAWPHATNTSYMLYSVVQGTYRRPVVAMYK